MIVAATLSSALTTYFGTDTKRIITVGKSEFFGVKGHSFSVNTTCRPTESFPVDLTLKSDSSIPMYVWLRIEMPIFAGEGIYTFENNADWTLQEKGLTADNKYSYVYRYIEPLEAEETTSPLTDKFTMRDMSKKEYGTYSNLAFTVQPFCSGTDGNTDPDAGWQAVKGEYNL